MTLLLKLCTGNSISQKLRYSNIINSRYFTRLTILSNNTERVCILNHLRSHTTNAVKQNLIKPVKQLSKKHKTSELNRLFKLAEPQKFRLLGALVFLIISSTVTMAVPFGLGKVIDIIYTIDNDKMQEKLTQICLVLLCVFVIGGFSNFCRVYLMSTSGHCITQRLRRQAYAAILSQETAMFDTQSTGELVSRLTADSEAIGSALTQNVSDGLRSGIMTLAGVSMMFYVSPQLALVGLAIVPPVVGLAMIYGRFVKKISREVQSSLATLNANAEEKISNIRTVKAFGQELIEIDKYNVNLQNLLKLCYSESMYKGIFFGLTGLAGNAIVLSVLYNGGLMISDASLTVGSLSSFVLYAAYVGISINGLSSFYNEFNKALGATTRLFELIDRKPAIPIQGGKTPGRLLGDIIFEKVKFSYPARQDCTILNNFDLNIPHGTSTAIVGPSGSGKSTVALLLLRLYDPNSGRILIDNNDLRELDPMWMKSKISVVYQEPLLFNGSIRENIMYGTPNASEAELREAAEQANVLEFAQNMTDGLDTIVGERGITLSGGQRQRVVIARALIKKPKILILDEATSALDTKSEYYVQAVLEKVTEGRTVLTIAHRLSTIKNADKIVVLDQGCIKECGSYSELMNLENGFFKKLVEHQTFS